MEEENREVFSNNSHEQRAIGSNLKQSQEVEPCREPTAMEYQLQRYKGELNALADNIAYLSDMASKLGIHVDVEDRKDLSESPEHLMGILESQNDSLQRGNNLLSNYIQALREVI